MKIYERSIAMEDLNKPGSWFVNIRRYKDTIVTISNNDKELAIKMAEKIIDMLRRGVFIEFFPSIKIRGITREVGPNGNRLEESSNTKT